jgi:hypothetical protein
MGVVPWRKRGGRDVVKSEMGFFGDEGFTGNFNDYS